MSHPTELLQRAIEMGLQLSRQGDKLRVSPGSRCTPEFADELRRCKRELLDLIEARAGGLSFDCAPWLHVAFQVMEGEFNGCDGSTRESVTIGLRSFRHPSCEDALRRLWPEGLP